MSNVNPELIAEFLDQFIKQFCLSLRLLKDKQEKQEAFSGLCKAIIINPNGIIYHFAFFCDAICQYDNSPYELEQTFQNIIYSYKHTLREKWDDCITLFPEKLKKKLKSRFNID